MDLWTPYGLSYYCTKNHPRTSFTKSQYSPLASLKHIGWLFQYTKQQNKNMLYFQIAFIQISNHFSSFQIN